jgi:hypothetical protein
LSEKSYISQSQSDYELSPVLTNLSNSNY